MNFLRFAVLALGIALLSPLAQAQVVPQDIVAKLIQLDTDGAGGKIFASTPTPVMRSYFSDNFLKVWTKAMTYAKDRPVLDADPLTGRQGGEMNRIVSIKVEQAEEPYANILVTGFDGQMPNYTTRFVFIYHKGAWKIDNMIHVGLPDPDLKAYLQKFQ